MKPIGLEPHDLEPSIVKDIFSPGYGHIPPHLAGREKEQSVFLKNLLSLSDGESPPAATVVYGPRGMGKTVLLSWFEDEVERCVAKDGSMRVVWATPNEIGSPSDLWNLLMPPEPEKSKRTTKDVSAGLNLGLAKVSATWESQILLNELYRNTLIDQFKKQPLILLMDEAHKMDKGMCNNLLNLHQQVSRKSPFMLVLAGTPGLRHFLSNVGATFIERSKKISLGRLDTKAAMDAISIPLEMHGIEMTDNALSLIVEDSQCYPYFLQEWGSSLWAAATKENLSLITEKHVEESKKQVVIARQDMYTDRRQTLNNLGLPLTTIAIAKAFQDTKGMFDDAILDIISENLLDDSLNTQNPRERLQTFIDHDFVWQQVGSDLYEAGIPSLMSNVLNYKGDSIKTKSDPKVERPGLVHGDESNGQGY